MDTRMILISRSHLYFVLKRTRKEARARKSRSSKNFSVSTRMGFSYVTSGIALELNRRESNTQKHSVTRQQCSSGTGTISLWTSSNHHLARMGFKHRATTARKGLLHLATCSSKSVARLDQLALTGHVTQFKRLGKLRNMLWKNSSFVIESYLCC